MNKFTTENKNALVNLFFIYVALDLIWALIAATLAGSLLSSGINLAYCGLPNMGDAGAVGIVTGSLLVFVVALFQGAIGLVVMTFAFGILGTVVYQIFKPAAATVWKFAKWVLIADAVWAVLAATFFKSLLGIGLGLASGAVGCVSAITLGFFGSAAAWLLMFLVAFLQGIITAFVATIFGLIALVVISMFMGNSKGAK